MLKLPFPYGTKKFKASKTSGNLDNAQSSRNIITVGKIYAEAVEDTAAKALVAMQMFFLQYFFLQCTVLYGTESTVSVTV